MAEGPSGGTGGPGSWGCGVMWGWLVGGCVADGEAIVVVGLRQSGLRIVRCD